MRERVESRKRREHEKRRLVSLFEHTFVPTKVDVRDFFTALRTRNSITNSITQDWSDSTRIKIFGAENILTKTKCMRWPYGFIYARLGVRNY